MSVQKRRLKQIFQLLPSTFATIREGLATPAPQLIRWSSTFEKIEVPQRVVMQSFA